MRTTLTILASLLIVGCVTTLASGFEGEANVTNSVAYSLLPAGATEPLEGDDYAEDADLLLFAGDPSVAYFAARGVSSETATGATVGSGSSCSLFDSAEVSYISVQSAATATKRMYLAGDSFTIDYGWDGALQLGNPPSPAPGEFEVEFEEEGMIELGYRINVSARSDTEYFWQTLPEYGAWEVSVASAEGSMIIDGSTEAVTNIIPIEESGSETYGVWAPVDVGKPFDVTVTLETWVEGYGFDVTKVQDGLINFSSNFIDTLGADVVAGGSPNPVPEPATGWLMLSLLLAGVLSRRRRG